MKVHESSQIAQFLGIHVSEVLKHAGIPLGNQDIGSRILLVATINERGHLERLPEVVALPAAVIERANAAMTIHGEADSKIIAAQVRATTGPLAVFDDTVFLFSHTDTVEFGTFSSMAICRNRKGEQFLGKISSSRKTGECRVICFDGKEHEFQLLTATPILAIIP